MRRSRNGGITARGCHAIQYDFMFQGVRYRPSLRRTPTEANLRRARRHLAAVKERIAAGSFHFDEEFPGFRRLDAPALRQSQYQATFPRALVCRGGRARCDPARRKYPDDIYSTADDACSVQLALDPFGAELLAT